MGRLGMLAVAALGVVPALTALAGCVDRGGSDGFPQQSPAPPAPTATSTATAAPEGTATGDRLDCGAVEQARRDLADATNAELARLAVDRSDPRAFAVQVLVTGQQATEYWTRLREAIPASRPELRADAETVVSYWEPLNAQLDAIEIPEASDTAIQEATDRYLRISAQHPESQVLPVQERLAAQIEAACAEPAP